MWELQPKPELSVVFLNPLSLSARQRHQGFSSACSYSLHLHLGIAESRNFHQGSLASRWSLHILWAPRGNSEKPEEGVWAFSLYFCKGQICHMDTRVLTTAHMCLYREHLHGHPNWTTCPGVFPPVLAEHKSITYEKTQNQWISLHFWPSCWKSWLLDALKITRPGLDEAHERQQAVTFPAFHFMASLSIGLGGWLRACWGMRQLETEKTHAKPQTTADERSPFARVFAQRISAASYLDKLW